MITYPYRAFYAVAASERGEANALAAQVDPGDGSRTYAAPLVPAGGPPDAEPTHYACCTLLTREQHTTLLEHMGPLESLIWTRKDAATGEVLSTSNESIEEGASCSFHEWLDAESLQVQTLPPEIL